MVNPTVLTEVENFFRREPVGFYTVHELAHKRVGSCVTLVEEACKTLLARGVLCDDGINTDTMCNCERCKGPTSYSLSPEQPEAIRVEERQGIEDRLARREREIEVLVERRVEARLKKTRHHTC